MTTFRTEKEAQQFAEKVMGFEEKLWAVKTEWTAKDMAQVATEDVVFSFNGKECKGVAGMLKEWSPVQGALTSLKYLQINVLNFNDNFVVYEYSKIADTFDGKKHFARGTTMLWADTDGKTCKAESFTPKKNMDALNAVFGRYLSQK